MIAVVMMSKIGGAKLQELFITDQPTDKLYRSKPN